MEKIIHLLNGTVVNEGKSEPKHLVLKGGRIESVNDTVPTGKADEVIDCSGSWVIPGLIDDQVHFREPGFPKKGTIKTESLAAAVGGVTSYMEMPNTHPTTTDFEAWENKYAIAAKDSYVNYAFYMGASNSNIDVMKAVDPKRTPGIKAFMGSSTGNMRVSDPEILELVFKNAPILITTHCEDDDMIAANLDRYKAVWGEEIPPRYHPEIRSREACLASSSLAVELAKRHGTQLHILHITTAEELKLFDPGPLEGKSVTSEACVHHLHFDDSSYERLGHQLKCNPAVKSSSDREAIVAAVNEGRIDVIATDHAPHEFEYKSLPYERAPSGLPLVQHSLQVLLEHVHSGEFTIEKIVEKTSHAVAKRFDVHERGFIREGYWADLVVCKMADEPIPVAGQPIHSRCGWTPFEQDSFHSVVEKTFVSGNLVVSDGELQTNPRGAALSFNR